MIPKKTCSGRNVPSLALGEIGRRCGELLIFKMMGGVERVNSAEKEESIVEIND